MSKVAKRATGPQPINKQIEQLASTLQLLGQRNTEITSSSRQESIAAYLGSALSALSKVEQILNGNQQTVPPSRTVPNNVPIDKKEDALQLGQAEGRQVPFGQAVQGMFITHQNRVQYINASLVELLGYSKSQELLEAPLTSLVHPDFETQFSAYQLQALNKTQDKVPGTLLHKNGTALEVLLELMTVPFQETPVMLVMVHPAPLRQQQLIPADHQQQWWTGFLLEESPLVLYTTEAQPPYRLTFISENFRMIMGYDPEDHYKDPQFWPKQIHPDDIDAVNDALESQLEQGVGTLEYRFRFANGTYHWLYEHFRIIYTEAGEAAGFAGCLLDVTARKDAEYKVADLLKQEQLLNEELIASQEDISNSLQKTLELNEKLEASETFNKLVISNINEGVVVYDPEFRYQVWNTFMEERFGFTSQQVLGRRTDEVFPYVQKIGMIDVLQRALQGETIFVNDTYLPISKTEGYWVTSTYSPLINSQSEIIGVISTVTDVTKRKKAEEEKIRLLETKQQLQQALQINQNKFKDAQLIAGIGSWEWDLLNQTGRWSEDKQALYGLDPYGKAPELQEFVDMLDPEHKTTFVTAWQEAIEKGIRFDLIIKLQAPGKPARWERTVGQPIFDKPSGKVVKLIGITYDLTEQKQAEEKIAELLRISQEMNTRLLASEEELTQSLENTLELNEKIREREQRLQFALEGSGSGVWDWDLVTNEAFLDDRLLDLLGLAKDSGADNISRWESKLHPEDKEGVLNDLNKIFLENRDSYELEYRVLPGSEADVRWVLARGKVVERSPEGKPLRMTGTIMDITEQKHYQVSLANAANYLDKIINTLIDPIFVKDRQHRLVLVNDACCAFFNTTREALLGKNEHELLEKELADIIWQRDEQVFATGEDSIHEEIIQNSDGEVQTLITKKSLYVDSEGRPFVVGITMDFSDQKALEQRLKEQNENLVKINAELDSFVYRTSHDLRSPLASVLGLISVSRLEQDKQERLMYLDLMEKSIRKLDSFIHDIINYAKNARVALVQEEVDLQLLINEILEGLKFMEGYESIDKRVEIDQNTPFYSDLFRLKIIFNNLLSNAIKYRATTDSTSYILVQLQVNQDKAVFSVSDNGKGISEENLEKIFEMFFRASSASTGSGIGLYIVKEAVTTLNGTIRVASTVNQGTTFTIELPNGAPSENQPQ